MSDKKSKQKTSAEPQVTDSKVEYPDLFQEEVRDEVVESFSRGFQQDLRRILGEKYKEPRKS